MAMIKRSVLLSMLVVSSLSSGCYVEPGEGASIEFDGQVNRSADAFTMRGEVLLGGGSPTQEAYEDIHLEFYTKNGSLIQKVSLGTLHNKSKRLTVSVSLSTVPYYVIVDSPDIWDGETDVDYYVRNENADGGYALRDTTKRSELPILPDG
jgi:hypothetical protein